jgi:hypothetical protein
MELVAIDISCLTALARRRSTVEETNFENSILTTQCKRLQKKA